MKICGMMRLSEIDQIKVGIRLMKLSIMSLSEKVSKLYFLQIGNISEEIINFIYSLNKEVKIVKSVEIYSSGWNFRNNESLNDLYKIIDEKFDWILYPDADDILPENIIELIETADTINAETIRLHFIECFGNENKIIEMKNGFPIGPHFKAVIHRDDITFMNSEGFNEATSSVPLKRYETEYCVRHLRYATEENINARKNMNYIQEYFLQDHETIDFKENEKVNYYKR